MRVPILAFCAAIGATSAAAQTTMQPGSIEAVPATTSSDIAVAGPIQAIKPKRLRLGPSEPARRVSGIVWNEDSLKVELRPTALQRFYIRERADRPCELNVFNTAYQHDPNVNTGTTSTYLDMPVASQQWHGFMGCDRNKNRGGTGGSLEFELASNEYVRKLRVCTNGDDKQRGDLIKGIQLETTRVDDKGKFRTKRTVTEKQPNCKEWKQWSSCPNRSVAGDVTTYYRVSTVKEFVGMRLSCRKVEYTTQY